MCVARGKLSQKNISRYRVVLAAVEAVAEEETSERPTLPDKSDFSALPTSLRLRMLYKHKFGFLSNKAGKNGIKLKLAATTRRETYLLS